ncbi:MAG: M20/M25/M40 family metallo-hydrolase, partial [Bacteroidota bacterium]
EVILTVAEEAGLLGARQLSARELGADCAFVVDGPGPPGAIVIQGAAGREFRAAISARGDRDGRSVGPEPRWVANRALARLPVGETADGAYLKVWTEDNGAEIILTGAVNARSEEEVKRRLELVRAILRESAARYGLDHTFQTGRGYPGYCQPVSAPVVQLAVSAAQHVLAKPLLLQHRWASDANILNGLGIPAVCLGGAWHEEPDGTPWCRVDELSRGVEFLLALVALAATRPVRR